MSFVSHAKKKFNKKEQKPKEIIPLAYAAFSSYFPYFKSDPSLFLCNVMLLPNLITFKIIFGLRNDWNKLKKSVYFCRIYFADIFAEVNLNI